MQKDFFAKKKVQKVRVRVRVKASQKAEIMEIDFMET